MPSILEKLSSTDGILAAALINKGMTLSMSATSRVPDMLSENWEEAFAAAASLLDKTSPLAKGEIRVIAGDYILTVLRFDEEVLAVATILGHPVAKSLRRMLTRAMKSMHGVSSQRSSVTS